MALQVGELYATLKIDDKGVNTQLGGLGSRFGQLGSLASGAMAAAGAAIAGAVAAGVVAMGAALKQGIQYNAMLEQSAISWETLTKSQEKAKFIMSELQSLAAKTPFEFEGLDKSAKLLHMAGFEGKNLIDTLRIVGDSVSAVGGGQEELEGVSMALFQMGAKGKISAEEMNQLAERGIPSWKLLADSMGLSVAEVMKLSEQGKLMASDALPKIIQGMDRSFGGAMQKQAGTFNGLMANLKDTFLQTAAELSKPLFDGIKEALPFVIEMIKQIPMYLQQVGSLFTSVGGQASTFLAPVIEVIQSLVQDAVHFMISLGQQLQAFWQQNGAVIMQALQNIWAFLQPFVQQMVDVLGVVLPALWQTLKTVIQTAVTQILNIIQLFSGIFTGNWSKAWEAAKNIVSTAVSAIWNLVSTWVSSLFSILGIGLSRMVQPFVTMTSSTLSVVKGWISSLVSFGGSLVNSFMSAIRPIVQLVATVFQTLSTKILQPLKSINLYEIGRNIIQGLINGLSAMVGSLMNKAASIANGIKNKIKSALDIHSPSRVTFQLGQFVGQGLALGMERSINNVTKHADRLAMAAKPNISATSNPSAVSSTRNNHYTFHIEGNGSQLTEKTISNELIRLNWLYG
ncbi:tape measure protein [Thermoactinomyces sp. DSM 45892]|uniref:tape measure protein n=1 Tax=Thermoactinomyces sp. DSM 45892 TaxID=1882753 RepID=UPI00089BC684|nr:tape measure protein [Thermoactinomyces sp. DSM 45892]SDZ01047.1 tape measure domain-containing protein [Thermoactinomyces sp. DSM 45892]